MKTTLLINLFLLFLLLVSCVAKTPDSSLQNSENTINSSGLSESSQIASSIDAQQEIIPATSETIIKFPATEYGKTENNKKIFEIGIFTVSLCLPSDFEIITSTESNVIDGDLYSTVGLYKKDDLIATIGYNTFTLDSQTETNPRAIYNEIMLGSVVNWGNNYQVVKQGETISALCNIYRSDLTVGQSNAGSEHIEHNGILAHNNNLQVYIGIEFLNDFFTKEQIQRIAESIVIS